MLRLGEHDDGHKLFPVTTAGTWSLEKQDSFKLLEIAVMKLQHLKPLTHTQI